MHKLITICIVLVYYADAFSAKLLDTCQLPLSRTVVRTFPKLNAKYFIITVPKLGIVLHELNSNRAIRCGNFIKILNGMASLSPRKISPNIDQFLTQYGRQIPKYTDIAPKKFGILISLYELANLFEQEYLYIYRNCNNKRISKRIKLFAFYSGQHIGCICRYTNMNNVTFDVIVYAKYNDTTFLHDIEKTIQWLDGFAIKETSGSTKMINIPVFYGKRSCIHFKIPTNHEILVRKDKREQITRTIKYHMRLSAPVTPADKIGVVFYKYSLFNNPIKLDIYSNVYIQKSSMFNNLLDSIYYIIYNSPRAY